jgi:superfamily II DNA or RNA helicase
MELRPYQVEAIERVRSAIRAGHRRVCLVAPTGSGKTVIAAHIVDSAVARGGSVLFLAHRRELVGQTCDKLGAIGVRHGVIMADDRRADPGAPVQVASVQTLVRRTLPSATVLIVDECHHTRAKTWASIVDAYPSTPLVGLTATPWRGDGKGLASAFDASVVVSTPAKLVEAGWLVPVDGFSYDAPRIDARMRGGDFASDDLDTWADSAPAKIVLGHIVPRWQQTAGGLRTVAFAVNIRHSRSIVAAFTDAGVAAEHLDGSTPKGERDAILSRLHSGETTVVGNCNVLTEGWDEPALGCIVMARPTASLGLYLQMVGRGRRPSPGKALIRLHDHAGNAMRHGDPDAPQDYDLTADLVRDAKRKGKPADRHATCGKCFHVYPRTAEYCPSCAAENPSQIPLPEVREAREVALRDAKQHRIETWAAGASTEERRAKFDAWSNQAADRGYKAGWAAYRFKTTFGAWPPWSWRRAS